MKSKFLLGLTVTLCGTLLLTGCGGDSSKNKVVCTADVEKQDSKYKGEIVAYLDSNDKVKDAEATLTFETEDEAKQLYDMYNGLLALAKQFAEDKTEIPNVEFKLDGKKVTIGNYAEFATTMGEEEEEESLIGMSKSDFIAKMEANEETKWTCK